jgi:hypothetical protein
MVICGFLGLYVCGLGGWAEFFGSGLVRAPSTSLLNPLIEHTTGSNSSLIFARTKVTSPHGVSLAS